MVDLVAEFPLSGLDELRGSVRIEGVQPGTIWSISAWPGQEAEFPSPGEIRVLPDGGRLVWAGRQMVFQIGAERSPVLEGAVTDQSDAWAWVRLSGADAGEVLVRLCPLDLRDKAFLPGTSARSLIGHMNALIIKNSAQDYEIAVFRSMSQTLRHELLGAMESVASRA